MKAEDQLWVLSELIISRCLTLDSAMATGCKCMHCPVYTLNDADGRVCEAETLEELIKEGAKLYRVSI